MSSNQDLQRELAELTDIHYKELRDLGFNRNLVRGGELKIRLLEDRIKIIKAELKKEATI